MPPTLPLFPKETHALYLVHTHTHTHTDIHTHPCASFPPSVIHTVHIQKPSQSFKPTHPLIPPSFFRFPLGSLYHQKQLGFTHSTRGFVCEALYHLNDMKRTENQKTERLLRSVQVELMWSGSRPRDPNTFLQL